MRQVKLIKVEEFEQLEYEINKFYNEIEQKDGKIIHSELLSAKTPFIAQLVFEVEQ